MLKLRGKSTGRGIAMGTAAVIVPEIGMFKMPGRVSNQLARTGHDTPIEPVDVVLLAREYAETLLSPPPWARVVGIAVEGIAPESTRRIPILAELGEALRGVPEDTLLLIDGDRGLLLVDPSPATVAAYQSEREHLAPRRRFRLEYGHQPVRTLDGRTILVYVRTEGEVAAWEDNGADGLYVPRGSHHIPPSASDEEQLEKILAIADAASGRPVTLVGDAEEIAASALLRAAGRGDFTLAVPAGQQPNRPAKIAQHLIEVRGEMMAEDEEIVLGEVRIAAHYRLGEAPPDSIDESYIQRIIIDTSDDMKDPADVEWLLNLFDWTTPRLLPVHVAVLPSGGLLETAIGLGATGLLVRPGDAAETKERIRHLDTAAIRQALFFSGSAVKHPFIRNQQAG